MSYTQKGWDLSELLEEPRRELVDGRLTELATAVTAFEAARPELEGASASGLEPSRLLDLVREYEELVERMAVLGAYGSLWFAADTQSAEALAYRGRIEHELTRLGNRVLFFTLWWKGLSEAEAQQLLPAAGSAPDARHFLEDLRRLTPFTLEERSEQLINVKDANGIHAVLTLYSMLTNRLEFSLELEGETRKLTRDELMSHVYSPTAELRAAAYRELYRVFAVEAPVLGQIYVHRVRDWHSENVELRGFASPLAVRNVANDLPDGAIEALLDVTRENVGLFQRYFELKAGWLGMERLRRYDLYAPIAGAPPAREYGAAVDLVLETFAAFHPDFAARAQRVFADDHVDAEVRKGKKGGAFCATVLPTQTPWVLLNYTGRVRDVATMAHELGHAVHSLLAADHSVLTQHACLPLAETASVFAEMLLTDRLLAEVGEPAARRELLAAKMDDIYATVMRQAYFTRFEIAAHEAILQGTPADALDAIYLETLSEQFGSSVEVGDEFAREWVSIPHIFQTPFYCYAYSFGQLLVLALYQRYKDEGEAFVPGYLALLARGGAARPEAILAEVGVDPRDPDFWRGGFAVVKSLLTELESL